MSTYNKRCSKCHKAKPLNHFHKNKRKPDGLQNYCKACLNKLRREKYVSNNNESNLVEYDRKKNKVRQERYRIRKSIKKMAQKVISIAVATGLVNKETQCAECGKDCITNPYHYKGYAPKNFLDVIWICDDCFHIRKKDFNYYGVWPYNKI